MVARSVLGLPAVRTSLLDHVPAAQAGRHGARRRAVGPSCARGAASGQAGSGTGFVMSPVRADDIDEDPDDDQGFYDEDDKDEDDDEEDEEEDEDDEEGETWQVLPGAGAPKFRSILDFGQ